MFGKCEIRVQKPWNKVCSMSKKSHTIDFFKTFLQEPLQSTYGNKSFPHSFQNTFTSQISQCFGKVIAMVSSKEISQKNSRKAEASLCYSNI